MANPTTNLSVTLPVVGGSDDAWGTILNDAFQSFDDIFTAGGTGVSINIDGGTIDGAVIGGSSAAAGTFTALVGTSVTNGSGTVGAPSYTFTGDTTTGLYRIGAGNIAIAISGVAEVDINSTRVALTNGLTVGGTAAVTGNATFSANVEIDGALNHDGTTGASDGIGFYGNAPVAQQAALTVEDATLTSGTDATVIDNIRTRLGELESRLQNYGLLP